MLRKLFSGILGIDNSTHFPPPSQKNNPAITDLADEVIAKGETFQSSAFF